MCKPEDSYSAMLKVDPQQAVLLRSLLNCIDHAVSNVREVATTSSTVPHSSSHNILYSLNAFEPIPLKEKIVVSHLADATTAASDSSNDSSKASTIGARIKKRRQKKDQAEKKKNKDSTEKGHKRVFVQHDYHDYSVEPMNNIEATVIEHSEKKNKGGISTPFPVILHDMLERADKEGFSNIVSWQPHGRAFQVHDQAEFVSKVMLSYFRQTRFSSFQRQLSLYGFLRLTRRGADHGAYYNALFLRGLKPLCYRMQRTRVKGYWVRQSSSPATEPDFYAMPYVHPEADGSRCVQSHNINTGNQRSHYAMEQKMDVDTVGTWFFDPADRRHNSDRIHSHVTNATQEYNTGNWYSPVHADQRSSAAQLTSPMGISSYNQADGYAASAGRNSFHQGTNSTFDFANVAAASNSNAGMISYFSSTEQHDLANFLSDVDLDSDEEVSVAYRNEVEFGRISRKEFANE
jgi:hypothetical protein